LEKHWKRGCRGQGRVLEQQAFTFKRGQEIRTRHKTEWRTQIKKLDSGTRRSRKRRSTLMNIIKRKRKSKGRQKKEHGGGAQKQRECFRKGGVWTRMERRPGWVLGGERGSSEEGANLPRNKIKPSIGWGGRDMSGPKNREQGERYALCW